MSIYFGKLVLSGKEIFTFGIAIMSQNVALTDQFLLNNMVLQEIFREPSSQNCPRKEGNLSVAAPQRGNASHLRWKIHQPAEEIVAAG